MKEFFTAIMAFGIWASVFVAYVNNIIWMFDNWGYITWIAKAGSILGTMFPPLGIILGVIHLF